MTIRNIELEGMLSAPSVCLIIEVAAIGFQQKSSSFGPIVTNPLKNYRNNASFLLKCFPKLPQATTQDRVTLR